jgi:hypothetical protein
MHLYIGATLDLSIEIVLFDSLRLVLAAMDTLQEQVAHDTVSGGDQVHEDAESNESLVVPWRPLFNRFVQLHLPFGCPGASEVCWGGEEHAEHAEHGACTRAPTLGRAAALRHRRSLVSLILFCHGQGKLAHTPRPQHEAASSDEPARSHEAESSEDAARAEARSAQTLLSPTLSSGWFRDRAMAEQVWRLASGLPRPHTNAPQDDTRASSFHSRPEGMRCALSAHAALLLGLFLPSTTLHSPAVVRELVDAWERSSSLCASLETDIPLAVAAARILAAAPPSRVSAMLAACGGNVGGFIDAAPHVGDLGGCGSGELGDSPDLRDRLALLLDAALKRGLQLPCRLPLRWSPALSHEVCLVNSVLPASVCGTAGSTKLKVNTPVCGTHSFIRARAL